jgi:hypothetical protein
MTPDALRRKLRALVAVMRDTAATEEERATARRLTARLKAKLRQEGVPEGDWSDALFRFGRALKTATKSTAPPPTMKSGSAKLGFRLGRALRQVTKK